MSAKILLVEDNPLTAKGLQYLLEREGYTVKPCATLEESVATLGSGHFDLALLDLTLPDGNGFDVASPLKQEYPKTLLIFLTAKDDEADVIQGLEIGAEDYITKPFRNRELLLRIRNALQRHQKSQPKIVAGKIELDLAKRSVNVDGQTINLTALEWRLLTCLVENAGNIVTRERLLDEIYDASGSVVNDNTLSVYLKRLRQKLKDPELIETIKNVGYRLKVD